jgi:RNA polymerase sigma factor (sigma-70 family)
MQPGSCSDDALLSAFLRGEADAVARAAALIRQVIRFKGCGIAASAEPDLIQESMLDLWRAVTRTDFRLSATFESFVRSMAYRRCVDWIRRRRRHEPIDPERASDLPPPEQALVRAEEVALGARVLAALPESCRELFRLRAVACLPYRQIATLRGRTEGALRTQMWECLREAKRILDRLRVEGEAARQQRRTAP